MKDLSTLLQTDLSGLTWDAWCDRLNDLAGDDGYCDPLGPDHAALLIEKKPILLVTFENHARIQSRSAYAQPAVWPLTEALQWSHMAVLCRSDTWFRDPYVYAHFDRLIDDGFFDEFDQVIFYGAGPCGYAACAFSVAVPGARVLALQPQATLDPRLTEWDTRFPQARRIDFTSRYGHAGEMLEAAEHAWIAYNPHEAQEAMHASLLLAENTTLLRAPHLGTSLEDAFLRMNVLFRILAQISAGKLTDARLAALMRARREDSGYLSNLMRHIERQENYARMAIMCKAVLRLRESRPIRRGLIRATRALHAQ